MNEFFNNLGKKISVLQKLPVHVDLDSDGETQSELLKAVKLHKKNKKKEISAPVSHGSGCATKDNIDQNSKLSQKYTDNFVKEWLNGNDNMTLDMQDLIRHFTVLKKYQKNEGEISKKSLSDYEKQGAIPKGIIRDTSKKSKKIQSKIPDKRISSVSYPQICEENDLQVRLCDVYLSGSGNKGERKNKKKNVNQTVKTSADLKSDYGDSCEEMYSRPFFYIVPENPSPNFSFPRGSYFVIPKTPDGCTEETIIFHPENSTYPADFNPDVEVDQKDQEVRPELHRKSLRNMNNLGKNVLERLDSHLNIGPMQLREDSVVYNLEVSCDSNKIFEKVLISPDRSFGVFDIAQKMEGARNESLKENEVYHLFPDFEESDLDHADLRVNCSMPSSKEPIPDNHLHEQEAHDLLNIEYLDYKIQKQYERMVRDLPESRTSDLLDKCTEFQGNEEKVLNYIRETQSRIRYQRLLTDLQHIVPNVDYKFLAEEIEALSDSDDIDVLTNQLLDSQNYPKIPHHLYETKRKLWLTYVINFDVKNYLLKVPKPEDFAGAAGDHNKAEAELIMAFLMSRYPTATENYLYARLGEKNWNITKTCTSLVGFRVVRLSESKFEHENFDEDFLKEICYIDHKEEIDNHVKAVKETKEIEKIQTQLDGAFLFCPLCCEEELLASEAVTCPEGDVFCEECIKSFVEVKLSDAIYNIPCPMENCEAFFTIPTLEKFLLATVTSIIIKKQQAEEISTAEVEGLEFCLQCDFAYIPNPEDKIFKCQNPNCLAEHCRSCHEENHTPLRCEEIERQVDLEARKKIEETMTEKLIRNCPKCKKKFVKIDGCNFMKCVCGTGLCYICNKIIQGYDHFDASSCPLNSTNESLHTTAVLQAGIQVKNEILMENPNIRILYDPTKSSEK